MKPKMILMLTVDVGMTATLLLLIAYELIGQAAHEWIGIGMFVLFIFHHILNGSWSRNIMRGKYNPMRIVQTVLVILVLCAMAGSMISGVILSRHALSFLPIKGGRAFARKLHMVSAYWGFVLMSVHLGLHWNMMAGIAKKLVHKSSGVLKWGGRLLALAIAAYGLYAFGNRKIGSYMLLKNQFVFFDFEEPLVYFYLDYIAVMGLFIWIGNYIWAALKMLKILKTGRKK